MAGIYIHVPFCRQACRYCDFYFTVSLKYRDQYVAALFKEFSQRKRETNSSTINTIYLGGGTPSVLSQEQLLDILNMIKANYTIAEGAEITIEANPDDLNGEYLEMLKRIGFNRLSIGIQSFYEKDLELMRRSHSAEQAANCVDSARSKGFDNISIDLIYGLPNMTLSAWETNLNKAFNLPIQHLSAYHLTYETGTVFHHWKKQGKISEIVEQESVNQYNLLRKKTIENGFEHYEISNFCKVGFRSRHNTSYWNGNSYFGFGPAAHSYDGIYRKWNVSSIKKYIESLHTGKKCFSNELLSKKDLFNDYLITSLRMKEGVDMGFIRKRFGDLIAEQLIRNAKDYIKTDALFREKEKLIMTPEGWLKSDNIISDLMVSEEII